MGESGEESLINQQSSNHQYHYHTFETPPPKSRGRPNTQESGGTLTSGGGSGGSGDLQSISNEESAHNNNVNNMQQQTPLPKKQMAVLAMIALAEQTALNSFSPYLPDMVSSFPEVDPNQVGVSVGTMASVFALAQFLTNYFWGLLSDHIGRKPVILLGTILTAACFVAFGFSTKLWHAVVVQGLIGTVNGNQGLVSTCLGEITDRSNQSRVFTYLPVLYGIGAVTGPFLGGLLIFHRNPFNKSEPNPFLYLAPNLVSAVILVIDFILTSIFLDESLPDASDNIPKFKRKVQNLFSWLWQFTGFARSPTYLRSHYRPLRQVNDDARDAHSSTTDLSTSGGTHERRHLTYGDIFHRDTVLILISYFIFSFGNVAFGSQFLVFSQAPEPLGRDLQPPEIGLTQGFSGVVSIVFQILVFGRLRDKLGNRWTYRASFLGFVLSFILLPFVGFTRIDGKRLVVTEMCAVLLIKTVATIGGLTSALLLVRLSIYLPRQVRQTITNLRIQLQNNTN